MECRQVPVCTWQLQAESCSDGVHALLEAFDPCDQTQLEEYVAAVDRNKGGNTHIWQPTWRSRLVRLKDNIWLLKCCLTNKALEIHKIIPVMPNLPYECSLFSNQSCWWFRLG